MDSILAIRTVDIKCPTLMRIRASGERLIDTGIKEHFAFAKMQNKRFCCHAGAALRASKGIFIYKSIVISGFPFFRLFNIFKAYSCAAFKIKTNKSQVFSFCPIRAEIRAPRTPLTLPSPARGEGIEEGAPKIGVAVIVSQACSHPTFSLSKLA